MAEPTANRIARLRLFCIGRPLVAETIRGDAMSMRRPQAFAQAADFNGEIARVGNLHLQYGLVLLFE